MSDVYPRRKICNLYLGMRVSEQENETFPYQDVSGSITDKYNQLRKIGGRFEGDGPDKNPLKAEQMLERMRSMLDEVEKEMEAFDSRIPMLWENQNQ